MVCGVGMGGKVSSGDPRTHPNLKSKQGRDSNPAPVVSGWPSSLTIIPVPLSVHSKLSITFSLRLESSLIFPRMEDGDNLFIY